jgi:glycerol kinase
MDGQHILALDAGTSSSRAIVFDRARRVVAVSQREFRQMYPRPGWVEHDPAEIWETQVAVAREALAKASLSAKDVAAIGIANQRETTVVWNRETGRPVCNAIVWQCRRTSGMCDELRRRGLAEGVRAKTGLPIDAYFSGTKLRWILDNVKGSREDAAAGKLLFGTIDAWLVWNLTGGRVHATDVSNASRTMLFDIGALRWDDGILKELDIPAAALPEVRPSSGDFGESAPALFGAPIPVRGVAGDQQGALFGQACFEAGDAKSTYGTGCFMLMNTGTRRVPSANGLLTTIAWNVGGRTSYALEGSVFVAGAAIQWLRDELGLLSRASDSEAMARSVPDANGCYVVPAFTGLGAPYWDQHARGAILGLTRGVGKNHVVRATLESLAYQAADVLEAMRKDAGIALNALRVDGGASANDFLMQFQSDMIGVPVERPACIETTALGAACLAGLSAGLWGGLDELKADVGGVRRFEPSLSGEAREAALAGWHRAVGRVLDARKKQNFPPCA